jgi:glutamate-1-semialdehyde 2,1-aminomutase/spore coat polysaccharide biosynthesis protein SpsF
VGAHFVQGSADDVLARYVVAACSGGYDAVMRVTSDCPLIDWAVCRAVFAPVLAGEADYSCNNAPPTFPHGLDCEAFTIEALLTAAYEATDRFDREHVTPYLRRQSRLRSVNLQAADERWRHLRVTLDYPEDLDLFRAIESVRPLRTIESMQDLISVFVAHPALAEINGMWRANR